MTDVTDILPLSVWENIAGYLPLPDLAAFKATCHLFNAYGSHPNFLRHIYREYFSDEVAFLKKHHSKIFNPEVNAILSTPPNTIQDLVKQNAILNQINSFIIKSIINRDTSSTYLNLSKVKITRLPLSLLKDQNYQNYLQNLNKLHFSQSQMQTLDLRSLSNLEELACIETQLSSLKIQDLSNLKVLACQRNRLETLDIEGLTSLERIYIEQNPMTHLKITRAQQERLQNYLPAFARPVAQPSEDEKNDFAAHQSKLSS